MRIAAVDVGTNTALLLIADVTEQGRLTPLYDERRFIRLGEGVDASRHVSAAAMQRLRAALLAYKTLAARYEAAVLTIGATSASRDAQNQAALIAFVQRETGLTYEVISGVEEATWSFRGALSALPSFDGPCAVIDIGGGSTEIVIGEAGGRITARHSLNVGSVRLTERFFARQPPSAAEAAQAEAFVLQALDEVALPLPPGIPLISAAETPLLVTLVEHGVSAWEELGRSEVMLAADIVRAWRGRLLTMPYEEVLALNPSLMTGRADVFPAAVLLLAAVLQYYDLSTCRVSPYSLRHGLALRAAHLF